MLEQNVSKVLAMIGPNDLVLDVGGWACPFNRANYVMDAEPYKTRGYYGTIGLPAHQGGDEEYFSADTWIQRDICDREPFPFADKQFHFVVCSHTLEDLRDPLWTCAEIVRVGKRGYVEVPSRVAESSRGWEHPRMAGLSHHRWLIECQGNGIDFLHKYHSIHSHWRYSLPASYLRRLPEREKVQWLFWEDSFEFRERIIHGVDSQLRELEQFVERFRPYGATTLAIDTAMRRVGALGRRLAGKLRRMVSIRQCGS